MTPPFQRRTAVPSRRGNQLRLTRPDSAPDASDLADVRRWTASAARPTAVDLFCGAGGLSLGLRDAGFTVLLGADSNAWAVETHTANLGGLGYVGDLSDPEDLIEQLDGWGIRHVDVVAGGVPCQPFSRAGQAKIRELIRSGERHPSDPRASLWRSFMRVVEHLRPRAVLVENVPDLPAWDDGAVLSGFLESLGALEYEVDARIIDCFRFGVPQHRSRLILVGLQGGRRMQWPEETNELVSLRDAIGDLPPVPGGQTAERLPYSPRAGSGSDYQDRMRRDLAEDDRPWITDHITRSVREDDWEAYCGLAEGQTYADVPAHLQRYRTDIFTDKYKRLSWEQLSRTITAHISKDGYWYIHPEQHRTLSLREAARVQSFPDWFRFAGQPSHRLAQVGNAVPPLVGEAVGGALRESLAASDALNPADTESRRNLLEWHEARPPHPWRGANTSPWLVLAAELGIDPGGSDLPQRFESLRAVASSASALVALADPEDALVRAGLSSHAATVVTSAARVIDELFDGVVPEDDLELRAVPGVGDSIAKSVLCFGHARRVVPLHNAAARVATRFFGASGSRRWQLRLDLYRLAGPRGPDAEFTSAVLELGTKVCVARRPRCGECPLQGTCRFDAAAESESESELAAA